MYMICLSSFYYNAFENVLSTFLSSTTHKHFFNCDEWNTTCVLLKDFMVTPSEKAPIIFFQESN